MPSLPPDKFKSAKIFWRSLKTIGISPAALLRQSGLPITALEGETYQVTTAQYFSLWRALAELDPDPSLALKLAARTEAEHYHPIAIAALHARDFRDALTRISRYKQLCTPEEIRVREVDGEVRVDAVWFYAKEEEPPLAVDAFFGNMMEIGRRGTGGPLHAKRIELARPIERTGVHAEFFGCPVKFNAKRNLLVLNPADLERPFVTHNADLLEMISPQLEKALAGKQAEARICERVKWILKKQLAGNRPDIDVVARELGLSGRTLQRRITAEGGTFRELLQETRQELVRQYLSQASIEITEAAYLLGYEDPNSFYRAFRAWKGTTPSHWRESLEVDAAQRN